MTNLLRIAATALVVAIAIPAMSTTTEASASPTQCKYGGVQLFAKANQQGASRTLCAKYHSTQNGSVITFAALGTGNLSREVWPNGVGSYKLYSPDQCSTDIEWYTAAYLKKGAIRNAGWHFTQANGHDGAVVKKGNLPKYKRYTKYVWKWGYRKVIGGWAYGYWKVPVKKYSPIRNAITFLNIEGSCAR